MQESSRTGQPKRLLRMAAVTAALVAIGVGATTTGANAGTTPAPHKVPANAVPAKGPLPTIGARKALFGARSATTKASAGAADIAATPWVVGVETQYPMDASAGNGQWYDDFCTGTVVSPTKVLLQPGCAGIGDQSRTVVIAGREDLTDDSSGFVAGVASTWQGPTNPEGNNGLEVLTLQQPLPAVYTPISMIAQGNEAPYAAGTAATLVGYGVQGGSNGMVLSQAAMTTQAASACAGQDGFDPTQDACVTPNTPLPTSSTAGTGQPLVIGNKLAGVAIVVGGTVKSQLAYPKLSEFDNAITADLGRPNPGNEDWNGDGIADLFGENGAGQLVDYEGDGLAFDAGLADQLTVDRFDWSGVTLLRATNWNSDGRENLLEVAPNGNLIEYYPNNSGNGGIDYSLSQTVGSGFNQFTKIISTNNWNGDGHPDLIAEKADGSLWLYERTGNGWVNGSGVQIGSGFNQFTSLMAFQWTDNGHTGLLGVTSQGALEFYATDGGGHWTTGSGQLIGVGFSGLRTAVSPGSWGGTDTGALMTVDAGGNLKAYQANGTGGWLFGNGIQVGVGFQTLKALF